MPIDKVIQRVHGLTHEIIPLGAHEFEEEVIVTEFLFGPTSCHPLVKMTKRIRALPLLAALPAYVPVGFERFG